MISYNQFHTASSPPEATPTTAAGPGQTLVKTIFYGTDGKYARHIQEENVDLLAPSSNPKLGYFYP